MKTIPSGRVYTRWTTDTIRKATGKSFVECIRETGNRDRWRTLIEKLYELRSRLPLSGLRLMNELNGISGCHFYSCNIWISFSLSHFINQPINHWLCNLIWWFHVVLELFYRRLAISYFFSLHSLYDFLEQRNISIFPQFDTAAYFELFELTNLEIFSLYIWPIFFKRVHK